MLEGLWANLFYASFKNCSISAVSSLIWFFSSPIILSTNFVSYSSTCCLNGPRFN
jgi:hypothetical protein